MDQDFYTAYEWNERAGYEPKICANDCVLSKEKWNAIFLEETTKDLQLTYIKNGCGFGAIPKKGQA
jgi:hypothetical protein